MSLLVFFEHIFPSDVTCYMTVTYEYLAKESGTCTFHNHPGMEPAGLSIDRWHVCI